MTCIYNDYRGRYFSVYFCRHLCHYHGGLLGAMAFALTKLVKLLDTLTNKLDPVIVKATDTIETVQRVTTNVGEKADQILDQGRGADGQCLRQGGEDGGCRAAAVTGPLINLSSLITGVSKGFSVYTHSSTEGGKVSKDNSARQNKVTQDYTRSNANTWQTMTTMKKSGGAGGFFAGCCWAAQSAHFLRCFMRPQGGDQTRDLIKQKTDEYSDLAKSKART